MLPAPLETSIDQYFAGKTPIPRPGYPGDFEAIAAYLASDASSFHSGDTIVKFDASTINRLATDDAKGQGLRVIAWRLRG